LKTNLDINNYITPNGLLRLKKTLLKLIDKERPEVVRLVSWAASNGDRSENADYIYGKRKLREIDKKIFFLTKRIKQAKVVNIDEISNKNQIFFGATVVFSRNSSKNLEKVTIVGIDEVDSATGKVSWISPIAKTLLKAKQNDVVYLKTPRGEDKIKIFNVSYNNID